MIRWLVDDLEKAHMSHIVRVETVSASSKKADFEPLISKFSLPRNTNARNLTKTIATSMIDNADI